MRTAGIRDVAIVPLVLVLDELGKLGLPRVLMDLGLLLVLQIEAQIVQQGEPSLGHLGRQDIYRGPLNSLVEVFALGLAPLAQLAVLRADVHIAVDALVFHEHGILLGPMVVLGGPPRGGAPRRDGIHLALGLDLYGHGLGELLFDPLDLGLGLLHLHHGLGPGLVGSRSQRGAAALTVGGIPSEADQGGTGGALNESEDIRLREAVGHNERAGDGQDLITDHHSQRFGMTSMNLGDINLERLRRGMSFEPQDDAQLGFAKCHFVLSSLSTIRTTAGSFSRGFFVIVGGLALIASRSSGSRRCGVVVVDLLHGRRGRSRRGDGGLVVSVVGVGVLGHGEGGGDGLVERGHHFGIHTGLALVSYSDRRESERVSLS
mmetsp:Transcript_8923/g.21004  ORF Transcript_8923/g.21004 Transcript_8923/m.21004 type:complete len:375 (-) Transcript_8923:222-1346(-)